MTTEAAGAAAHSPIEGTGSAAGDWPALPGVRALLVASIGLTFFAHAHVVLHRTVNWDEFWFLSFVYDHGRGTLSVPRQSFHVHLFGWLTSIQGHEIEQIIAARTVFLALLAGTGACVYVLARQTASVNGALFAVLCFTAYSNVLYHGTSFRADGLAVFLLMIGLVLLWRRPSRVLALTISALLLAVALLVTMKTVFFLPVFALTLLSGPSKDWQSIRTRRETLLFVSVSAVSLVGLYVWHRSGVVAPPEKDSVAYLESIAARAFGHEALFPGFRYFLDSLFRNPIQWVFLTYGAVTAVRGIRSRRVLAAGATVALLIPLVSLLFYRNAFPYFYVFIMPPALVLCGSGLDAWTLKGRETSRRAFAFVFATSLLVAVAVMSNWPISFHDTTIAQRTIVRAVHEIFPQPVPYLDRNGMISSFPKAGFFMSSWGIQNYQSGGRPAFADVLRAQQPKFLLANSRALTSIFSESGTTDGEQALLADDVTILREHFVPYWGPVYIAGRTMQVARETEIMWEVLLPGTYRVSSDAPVTIGGSLYSPGSTVELTRGVVSLHSAITQEVVLRTVSARGVPSYPPPTDPIYLEF